MSSIRWKTQFRSKGDMNRQQDSFRSVFPRPAYVPMVSSVPTLSPDRNAAARINLNGGAAESGATPDLEPVHAGTGMEQQVDTVD